MNHTNSLCPHACIVMRLHGDWDAPALLVTILLNSQHADAPLIWVASNCAPARVDFVARLMQVIQLVHRVRCGPCLRVWEHFPLDILPRLRC